MKRSLQAVAIAAALVVAPLATSGVLHAQATASSTLQGTIFDKKQAVMVGVSVILTNKATSLTRTATSNESGTYRFEFLPAGFYQIRVSASGFSTATADNIELLVGQTSTMDVILSPGTLTEVITVTTEAPLIDLQKTQVGLNVTPSEVQDYPLNGRDFANLAYLAPGARPVGPYDPTKVRYAIFGINGSNGRNVNLTVNGVDNKDNTVGGPVMQLPLEAVQEFNINTQRFSAANGRSEGAAVNVVTKSGGNAFHGSAYIFERNERFSTKNFFESSTAPISPFSRQQFGGSIGGPIRKDKDFFFFALERQREITNIVVTPTALAELNLVKNLGADPAPSIPTPYRDWRYTARLDHRISSAHNLFLTYNHQTNRGLNDQATQTSDLTAGNFTTNKLQLASLTLNSVLNPRVVNSFTFGYQYWNNLIDTDKLSPTFNFPGGQGNITFGTNTNVPQQSYQAKWQFRDDLSVIKGNHGLKTGVDFVYEPKLGGFFKFNPTLSLTFFDVPSAIVQGDPATCGQPKKPFCYPQGFDTPGVVSGMSATSGNPYFSLPAKMFGVYFQDDWKVSHGFTLNLGVRWDKDFNLIGAETQGKSRTYLQLKAINSPYARSLPSDDNRGISPRIGFAWDLTGSGKHTVRGGYGLYFGQTFLNIPLFMVQQSNDTIFGLVMNLTSAAPGDPQAPIVPGTGTRLSAFRLSQIPTVVIPPAASNLQNGSTGRFMDPDYRSPYTQQTNIGYAFQFTPSSAIEVDYVHVLSLHESKSVNINPTIRKQGGARPLTAAFTAAKLPILADIRDSQSVGRSRYDGLNLSYRQRMTHHFTVNASYVLSRSLGYNGNSAAFGNAPTDPFDVFAAHDFGPVPTDELHRFVASGVVELPWGFQIAPIMQLASARPYTALQSQDVFGFGGGNGGAHAIVPKSDPNNFLFTTGMSLNQIRSCLDSGACVESGFGAVRGQTFFQLDMRVSKRIRFGERASLRLIFQAFDLTNRANFGSNFVTSIRNPRFGQPNGFITAAGVIVPRSFSGEFGAQLNF